jgi:hypothetical protein
MGPLGRSSTRPNPAQGQRRYELRQGYREGQEGQLGALGLVVNAIALWNSRYLELALNHLANLGAEVKPEDIQRLSPLAHEHINLHGRYQFTLAEPVTHGELRPLRSWCRAGRE